MEIESMKKHIDMIAPELFRLQDLRRENRLTSEQKPRLESLEKEYDELMGKIADKTVAQLKQEGVLK